MLGRCTVRRASVQLAIRICSLAPLIVLCCVTRCLTSTVSFAPLPRMCLGRGSCLLKFSVVQGYIARQTCMQTSGWGHDLPRMIKR